MTYFGEIRTNWRFLLAAALGQAAGYSLVNYISNVFTPHLIKAFDWSRSEIALIGATAFLGILAQPIAGRLTDAFGVRRMALVGVVVAPLIFLGLSAMTGSLFLYFLLYLIQIVVVGGTTSATIYSRLIAQSYNRARGIALAIAACAPAAVGAAAVPFLSGYIDSHGWRAGYVAVAAGTAVVGFLALALIPASTDRSPSVGRVGHDPSTRYGVILRNPAFLLIVAGMILCNLQFTMQTSQLKVILLDRGITSAVGSSAVALFASSVIIGRLLCGVALDRLPTYAVAAISMGLPGIGLGMLATGSAEPATITVAVLLLGLSLGAEGDILAYLVMRFFRLEVFSTVLGLVLGGLALSVAGGSLLLSLTLKLTGGFTTFLVISGVSSLIGSVVLFQLKRVPTADGATAPAQSYLEDAETLK